MYKVLKDCYGKSCGVHKRLRAGEIVPVDGDCVNRLLEKNLIKKYEQHPSKDNLKTKPSLFKRLFRK